MQRDRRRRGAAGRKTKGRRAPGRLAWDGRVGGNRRTRRPPAAERGRRGQRAKPGGGGRRASRCRPFDPRRLPLIRSAFGDTGTKAVHHITERPGGSLRSRRLIRSERVGPAERAGDRPRGGGLGSALRLGALRRGRPESLAQSGVGTRTWVGGREEPLFRALLHKQACRGVHCLQSEARCLPDFSSRPF